MKLELKHLAAYFPYRLKVLDIEKKNIYEAMCLYDDSVALYSETMPTISMYLDGRTDFLKPILRPLSDLHKPIQDNGNWTIPANYLYKHFDVTDMEFNSNIIDPKHGYDVYVFLLSHYFDVFNLIEQGLAMDINTL